LSFKNSLLNILLLTCKWAGDGIQFTFIPVLVFARRAHGLCAVAGHQGKEFLAAFDEPRVLRLG
jgi:hypothetical protein